MKSFLHGKKTLAMPALRVPHGLAPAAPVRHSRPQESARKECGAPGESQVEAVKEGDRVVRLVVTCTCGERMEVECLYSAGG